MSRLAEYKMTLVNGVEQERAKTSGGILDGASEQKEWRMTESYMALENGSKGVS